MNQLGQNYVTRIVLPTLLHCAVGDLFSKQRRGPAQCRGKDLHLSEELPEPGTPVLSAW